MSSSKIPAPPKSLLAAGRAHWKCVLTDFEIEPAQLETLRIACEALDRADKAAELVKAQGLVCQTKAGPRQHPCVKIELDARGMFLRCMRALNLDVEPLNPTPGRPPGK